MLRYVMLFYVIMLYYFILYYIITNGRQNMLHRIIEKHFLTNLFLIS